MSQTNTQAHTQTPPDCYSRGSNQYLLSRNLSSSLHLLLITWLDGQEEPVNITAVGQQFHPKQHTLAADLLMSVPFELGYATIHCKPLVIHHFQLCCDLLLNLPLRQETSCSAVDFKCYFLLFLIAQLVLFMMSYFHTICMLRWPIENSVHSYFGALSSVFMQENIRLIYYTSGTNR